MKVYLSYAVPDRDQAEALAAALQARGAAVIADTSFVAGRDWTTQQENAIRQADKIVLLLSHRTSGELLKKDAWTALREREHAVVPILLDEGGTRNFVWSLVADLRAIRIDDHTDLAAAASDIARVREPAE